MSDTKIKREANRDRRFRAYAMLYQGYGVREVARILEVGPGTVSKWHASRGYEKYESGQDVKPELTVQANSKGLPYAEKRDRFIQALSVGAVNYARLYAACSDGEAAEFMREVEASYALAKPRIAVLGMLLKTAMSARENSANKMKAADTWWRLTSNEKEAPLIHINTTGNVDSKTPTQIMIENMERLFLKGKDVDLMGDKDDSTIVIDS